MTIKDLQSAADKVIAVDPNDEQAVDKVIEEIKPIVEWCRKYLEQEEQFYQRLMIEFIEQVKQKVEVSGTTTNVK